MTLKSPELARPTTSRWFPFFNNSGETAPAFAVMEVTDITYPDAGVSMLSVDQPSGDSLCQILVNGPTDVANQGYGMATYDFPAAALYNTGGATPVAGDSFGTKSGQWTLEKDNTGFCVLGGVTDGRVVVVDRGGAAGLKKVSWRVEILATQYLAQSTFTKVLLDEADVELNDATTGTDLVEINTAGDYWVSFNASVSLWPLTGSGSSAGIEIEFIFTENGTQKGQPLNCHCGKIDAETMHEVVSGSMAFPGLVDTDELWLETRFLDTELPTHDDFQIFYGDFCGFMWRQS